MQLSEGEFQRLMLARVLLREIDVLLIDEATSNLDPANEQAIMQILHRQFGDKILVLVCHKPADYHGITKQIQLAPPT